MGDLHLSLGHKHLGFPVIGPRLLGSNPHPLLGFRSEDRKPRKQQTKDERC